MFILFCVGRKGKEKNCIFGVRRKGKESEGKKLYFRSGGKWEGQNEFSQCVKEMGRKY